MAMISALKFAIEESKMGPLAQLAPRKCANKESLNRLMAFIEDQQHETLSMDSFDLVRNTYVVGDAEFDIGSNRGGYLRGKADYIEDYGIVEWLYMLDDVSLSNLARLVDDLMHWKESTAYGKESFTLPHSLSGEWAIQKVDPGTHHDEYFAYLNSLRAQQAGNTFGFARDLGDAFGLEKREARDITARWMKSLETLSDDEMALEDSTSDPDYLPHGDSCPAE